MSNDKKVVLVTGGSAGIGEAVAIEFAKIGYRVVVTGRNPERLNQVMDSLVAASSDKSPKNHLTINANFEVPAEVEPIVEKTVTTFGRLDVVVNNAGYPGRSLTFADPDFYQDFQNIMQVNLMAATRIAQLSIPHLSQTKGVIINITSIADRTPFPMASYCISKAGMSMMNMTLANSLVGTGIRCVAVAPGPIVTNFAPKEQMENTGVLTSLGRPGSSKEVADLVLFLASDKASFIHGCTVDIDGGTQANMSNIVMASIGGWETLKN